MYFVVIAHARAKYDYEARDPREISIKVSGSLIMISAAKQLNSSATKENCIVSKCFISEKYSNSSDQQGWRMVERRE